MYQRFVKRRVEEALSDTPVVLIVGPRRAGKTTLVRQMNEEGRSYITLDDQTVLAAAQSDPAGFIRGLDRVVIDEIQRAPDLLLAIKKTVDEDYRPGRFLLTGSANVLTLPRVADSLAGRMETIRMLPLARAEVEGATSTFLDRLFEGKLRGDRAAMVGDDLVRLVLLGGFPEAIARESERRRQDWVRAYLTSVLTRDLRDIADLEKLTDLPKFVRLLAEHSGQLVNYSQFGSSINVTYKTAQRYIGLLEQIFLIATLQPWYTNALKRIAKTPKLHFLDSGVLAAARGLTFDRVKADRGTFGALLESFVFSEVLKLMSGSDLRLAPYHFRDQQSHEADLVLERDDGTIVGIEVKASATVKASDFGGLKTLSDACGGKFAFGIVLYDGTDVVPFGERIAAAPLSCLWR
ncbi:putative ATPase (AAA+ superfamily) [Rhizobium leguminosarum bv. trifolii WSM597]|uniref:ATP-binding protein n=2 Tax=Rhizobium TaxID=379 RepID=A0AAE5WUD8_9HYPH|nr:MULTISPECIES: ATP-binding protein [Rhizobium]EJB01867.1 putative ATPase (AAA+ superfamily) [Rhizobium leguminosarum bv. trifolii WSM597]KPH04278.1 AAA family ATPase [Rhizobium acidisoli]QAS82582.1 ATP-binding protein [Rhizobium acidisoli]